MKTCLTCQLTYPDDFSHCPCDGARLPGQAGETEAQFTAGLSRRFRFVRRLGREDMGAVFLAEQIDMGNRPVALKVLNRKLLEAPGFLERFQSDGGSTGRIHHANVVTIHEVAQADDGTPYITMEFLEGESLREALKRRGALPVSEVAEILHQVAKGLNAAHELGIIHRDLKPANILVTHGDEGELVVKVVDFGIAGLRESSTRAQNGTVLGTPAYVSSEQAWGMKSEELDARSDVYSLGVIVYEVLTGRLPFHSDTPFGCLCMHMLEDPPPFRAVARGLDVPSQIEAVVMKALKKERAERFQSALEFAHAFEAAARPARVPEASQGTATPEATASPGAAEPDAPITSALLPQNAVEATSRTRLNPLDDLKYVRIPPGTFVMGCSPGDGECEDKEKPPHQVTLTRGFWLGKTVVTAGAYKRFAAATGKALPPAPCSNPGWSNEQMPMVSVTWDEAKAYCAWAGGRLPSEAEWEYAARAGTIEERYGPIDEIAWYESNSGLKVHEVGQKRANAFGLYDMLGNVFEWVNDPYDEKYYQTSPAQDPPGPACGPFHVLRGGSWAQIPIYVRASFRARGDFTSSFFDIGFRCALDALEP
ncbi:MAG: bifunctional serine/threonine-protein kinase/formylglycine-generating enzyme family protein [Terriglobia bacterium]